MRYALDNTIANQDDAREAEMAAEDSNREMLRQLFDSIGLELSDRDLAIASGLHVSFAAQRARLAGAARPDTEPMIVPDFERVAADRREED